MKWNESIRSNCFVLVKFAGLLFLAGYNLIYAEGNLIEKTLYALTCAFFIMFAVMVEWKERWVVIIMEGILALGAVFLFPAVGIFFAVVWILDMVTFLRLGAVYFMLGYIGLKLNIRSNNNFTFVMIDITFLVILYIQDKIIIKNYENIMEENEETEGRLKVDMEREKKVHNQAIRKSQLQAENDLLEERNRIGQAMHDKLGHSINGSLYQLEAAKLLVEKEPATCENILQQVIDQLRQSMNEIRIILRREQPDKKSMAVLSLQSLCKECEERYHIHAELLLQGEIKRIPNIIWEVILDNTFEAVTNALKYAQCKNVIITIAVLNQVVRCNICDDGIGSEKLIEGMGISGMKKRVRDIHGVFNIEARSGFQINMILPLEGDQNNE